jgi:hypothetical protein
MYSDRLITFENKALEAFNAIVYNFIQHRLKMDCILLRVESAKLLDRNFEISYTTYPRGLAQCSGEEKRISRFLLSVEKDGSAYCVHVGASAKIMNSLKDI